MFHTELRCSENNIYIQLFVPFCLILLAVIFEYSGFDIWWVSHFYDPNRQLWPYTNSWLFDDIIHSGGQYLDKTFALMWFALFTLVIIRKDLASHRKTLLYFLLASALGPAIVGIGKNSTHIYSPWDLQLFNGIHPYIRLFDPVPHGAPVGHAFPAGHASGGFCFVSLYFVLLKYRSPYRIHGLFFALLLGSIFGLGQQIRGAHFPSHDMFSLAICWYASIFLYYLFFREEWSILQYGHNPSKESIIYG